MYCQQLVQQLSAAHPVRSAVIGAGMFGSVIVAHSRYVPALQVLAVADVNLENARKAFISAGIEPERIVVCDSVGAAQQALRADRRIIAQNPEILFPLPLDVVAEATGIPESGALHARSAIEAGKHVAMVTKEADAAVGPMLKRLADRAGVVYTAVEGDQHGMLMGLIAWGRMLGMEVLCGAKALDGEVVFYRDECELDWYGSRIRITPQQAKYFGARSGDDPVELVRRRREILGEIAGAKPWDLVELTIAANGTGLSPDCPTLHCPPCLASEIPGLLCPRDLGGLLDGTDRIDAVQVIRRPDDPGLGGGVLIVVRLRGDGMHEIAKGKGMVCGESGESALLVLPHHLLGIEAIGSMLSAAVLRQPTGAIEYQQRFDVVYKVREPLPAGSIVGHDHSPELTAEMVPAAALRPDAPLPSALARGNRLCRAIAPGQVITLADIESPTNSPLWDLRRQQDRLEFKL